jgi:hypothetical protein
MINTALHLLELGLSVIPVKPETKSPTVATWKPYQTTRMTPDQAFFMFQDVTGIALIGGKVSGNVEIIDFDNHQGDATATLNKFKKLVTTTNLIIQSTPSGGYHIIYRCEKIAGNLKLAQRLVTTGKPDTIIETRGEGGYALIDPSPNYKVIHGSFDKIPTLTVEERDDLIAAARSFNEYSRPDHIFQKDTFGRDSDLPGTMYNDSSDGRDEVPVLLQRAGWKSTDGRHWRRPGKDRGISATWGKCTAGGIPLFYVFSSNAGIFEDQRSYKPFQIFALLAHNGDFEGAAKELRQRGFGKELQNSKELFSVAMQSIRAGVKQPNYAAMSQELNIPEPDVRKQVDKIYEQNKDEFNFEKKTDIEKVEIYLNKHYKFRHNVVTQKTEMRRGEGEWVRMNENTIYCEFQRKKIKFTFDKLKSLLRSDYVPDYDPFLDYFNSLPPWDGVDYVFELSKYVTCVDQEWFAFMLLKHLVRAVKCAIEPEYYNRMVFTLVSEEQEIGKSYFIRFLNPFGLQYYSEEFLRDDKDSQFRLSENFIYNLEELDTLNKMDIGKLKAMISKQGVNERIPYESQKINLPRRCTFFGSTNRSEFLLDDRNTRWMVFDVKDFNRDYSKNINIKDVWCQVWARYNDADFNCELDRSESAWRDKANKAFQIQETERTVILQHIEKATEEGEFMTNVDIMTLVVDATGNKLKLTQSPQKIGRIMSELGFLTGQRVINGKNCRVYYCRAKNYLKRNESIPF